MSVWDRPMTASEEQDSEFPVAVPGTYEFTVAGIQGKEYPGGAKMGKCARLNVRMVVDGKDARGKDIEVNVYENLFNDPIAEWKLLEFAKCIGIYHDRITAGEIMDKGQGMIGTASFKVEEYNGKKRNAVVKFLKPAKPAPAKKPADDFEDLPF